MAKVLIYPNSFIEDTTRLIDLISKGSVTISDSAIKHAVKDWVQGYYDLLAILENQGVGYRSFITLSNSVNNARLKKREWLHNLRTILKEFHGLSLQNRKGVKKFIKNSGFIDPRRLKDLKGISSSEYDLSRLVRMCEELNDNFSRENYISSVSLVRAILDHIPPIFRCKSFTEVANSCEKSIKESLQNLENSSRKIADAYLHIQVRKKEVLPTATQVNFSQSLDVLLGEIVRILK